MKRIVSIILVITMVITLSGCGGSKSKQDDSNVEKIYTNLRDTILAYEDASILTYKVLNVDPEGVSYETWVSELDSAINKWEELELKANELDRYINAVIEESENNNKSSSRFKIFDLHNNVYAYSKEDITAVYDAAPAGKRLKTLANYLGTDAKSAYKVLQMTNEQIKAEVWNNAGDTFEILENSARVLKDGCKVALHVGGTILTGGTATGTVSIIQKGALLVEKADLVLEIGQDTASIALGYNNDVTVMISKVKDATGTFTTIMGYKGLMSADTVVDKINNFSFVSDQINSLVQEGKIAGVEVDWGSDKVEVASLDTTETKDWLTDNKLSDELVNSIDNQKLTDTTPVPENNNDDTKGDINVNNNSVDNIVGIWQGVDWSDELKLITDKELGDSFVLEEYKLRFDSDGQFYIHNKNTGWIIGGTYTFENNSGTVQDSWADYDTANIKIKGGKLELTYIDNMEHVIVLEKVE